MAYTFTDWQNKDKEYLAWVAYTQRPTKDNYLAWCAVVDLLPDATEVALYRVECAMQDMANMRG